MNTFGRLITAIDMAKAARINPKIFRAALRAANLRWHQHNAPWSAVRGSPEHQDMQDVLDGLTGRPVTKVAANLSAPSWWATRNASSSEVGEDTERLRARYRPPIIRALFIGESAPAGGTFFYAGNSQLYFGLKVGLGSRFRNATDFLANFKDAGYFLDDLVLAPINYSSRSERRRLHYENVSSLATRLSQYRPEIVISVLKAIKEPVQRALDQAGLLIPHHAVSFPGNGRQADFRKEMNKLLPLLP